MASVTSGARRMPRTLWLAAAALVLAVSLPDVGQQSLQAVKIAAVPFAGFHIAPFLKACESHALLVGEAGLMVAAFLLVGSGLLPGMRLTGISPTLRACLSFPVGYGAISFLLLGLLLVRLWFPLLLWVAFAAALGLSLRQVPMRTAWPFRLSGVRSGSTLGIAASLALLIPWLLGPELHRDAYEYHLAATWQWLAAHGLAEGHVLNAVHFPMFAELPFAFPLMLGHDGVPKLLHLTWFLAGVGAFAGVLPAGEGAWAALGLIACSTVGGVVTNCKNDGVMTALALLAWTCLVGTPNLHSRSPRVLLAGLLFGFAISTKYLWVTSLIWPVLAVILVRKRWSWLAGAAIVSAIVSVPWTMKEALLTGDPFYPMLSGRTPAIKDCLGGQNVTAWNAWPDDPVYQDPPLRGFFRYLMWENPAFLLAFAITVFEGAPRALLVGLSLIMSFACFHLFPAPFMISARRFFPVLAPAILLSFASWMAKARELRLAWLPVMFVCLAVLNRLPSQLKQSNPMPCAFGIETPEEFRAKTYGTFAETMGILRQPQMLGGRSVLAIGEIRSYLVPLPFLMGTPLSTGEPPLLWEVTSRSRNEAELSKRLRQINVGTIVHNPMRATTLSPRSASFAWDDRMLTLLESFVKHRTEPLLLPKHSDQRNGVFFVYRVLDQRKLPDPDFLFTLPGADILLAEGQTAMEAGNYARAIRSIEPVCRRFPRVGQFRNVLAYACHLSGDSKRAAVEYAAGLRHVMVDDINVMDAASVASVLGRAKEAVSLFSRAVDVYPDRSADALKLLQGARLVAIARQIAGGDASGAESLIAEGISDRRPAAILGRASAADQLAELRAARIVALASCGRRADAGRELGSFRRDFPLHGALSIEDLRRLLLSKDRLSP